jgi:hypothetical protein
LKPTDIEGLENLLETKQAIGIHDVARIHHRLMRGYPMPTVSIENLERCKPESRMVLSIDGFPAPSVDVFKGRLRDSDGKELNLPTYASFRTTKQVSIVPLLNLEKNRYWTKIPDNALNGLLGVIFPIRETFGPPEAYKRYPDEVVEWILRSNHSPRWDVPKEECPNPPEPSLDTRYLAMVLPEPFNFHFGMTCSVCPYGAIKIEPTYCYVDPYVCRGQKYSEPRSDETEEICWDCFNEGDGTISSKCEYVTIRKVVHMNPDAPKDEVPCCGKECGIQPPCPTGAVKLQPFLSDVPWHKFWYVDKSLCNGCMNCYNDFTCTWNCGVHCHSECTHYERDANIKFHDGEGGFYYRDIRPNYTVRMVAEIDEKLTLILVRIDVLRWRDQFYYIPFVPGEIPFPPDPDDDEGFDLIIWADKQERIPIELDKAGTCDLKMKEIPFTQRTHLGLFQKDGNLLGYQYCSGNLPIRSIGGKRYEDPTKLTQGGSLTFNSPIGTLRLDYLTKPVKRKWKGK